MSIKRRLKALALLFTLSLSHAAPAQDAARRTQPRRVVAVRAARMLDVRSGAFVNNPVVVVEDDKIISFGSNLSIPTGAQVLDLGNVTLLPGLIDCHTHVLLQPEDERGVP